MRPYPRRGRGDGLGGRVPRLTPLAAGVLLALVVVTALVAGIMALRATWRGGRGAATGPAAVSAVTAEAASPEAADTGGRDADGDGASAGAPVASNDAGGAATTGEAEGLVGATDVATLVAEGLASLEERDVVGDLPDVAREVVGSYRDGGFVLVHAGYLDLSGRSWGCVVQGVDGPEACLISQGEGSDTSHVRVLRMEEERWEGAYGDAEREGQTG